MGRLISTYRVQPAGAVCFPLKVTSGHTTKRHFFESADFRSSTCPTASLRSGLFRGTSVPWTVIASGGSAHFALGSPSCPCWLPPPRGSFPSNRTSLSGLLSPDVCLYIFIPRVATNKIRTNAARIKIESSVFHLGRCPRGETVPLRGTRISSATAAANRGSAKASSPRNGRVTFICDSSRKKIRAYAAAAELRSQTPRRAERPPIILIPCSQSNWLGRQTTRESAQAPTE